MAEAPQKDDKTPPIFLLTGLFSQVKLRLIVQKSLNCPAKAKFGRFLSWFSQGF
jgi:hypothetical protein